MSGLFIYARIFPNLPADIFSRRWMRRFRSRYPSSTSTCSLAGGLKPAPIWRNSPGKQPDAMKPPLLDELSPILSDEHLRERIDPQPGDALYLHLSDLLLA